jgi:hypothetical protein
VTAFSRRTAHRPGTLAGAGGLGPPTPA